MFKMTELRLFKLATTASLFRSMNFGAAVAAKIHDYYHHEFD